MASSKKINFIYGFDLKQWLPLKGMTFTERSDFTKKNDFNSERSFES